MCTRVFPLRKSIIGLIAIAWVVQPSPSMGATVAEGEKLFKTTCSACHKIGGGRSIGPDLAGVHKRRKLPWLLSFIKSSQSMIKAGDKDAVAIFNEFKKMPMPDQNLSTDQITSILKYIESTKATPGSGPKTVWNFTRADVERGKELFEGRTRLYNRGPSCNSCHSINSSEIVSGGLLAVDLTNTYKEKGGADGLSGLLKAPPASGRFAIMRRAYHNKQLKNNEVKALLAFLRHAGQVQKNHQKTNYGLIMAMGGLGGAAVLMVIFMLAWGGRKKKTVYREIFDRQVESS